jgi:hypothetical protein
MKSRNTHFRFIKETMPLGNIVGKGENPPHPPTPSCKALSKTEKESLGELHRYRIWHSVSLHFNIA